MMKKLYASMCFWALALSMMLLSCREDSDTLLSYAYSEHDTSNFDEASKSFEGQFKAIWTAMNCNYPIWDYEEENGVDWDQVYQDYLPKFRELDERAKTLQDSVSNSELWGLYKEILGPLHDGHFYADIVNLHNDSVITVDPSWYRKNPHLQTFYNSIYQIKGKKASTRGSDISEEVPMGFPATSEYIAIYENWNYRYACFEDNIVYLQLGSFEFKDQIENDNSLFFNLWHRWFNKIQSLFSDNDLKGVIIDLRYNGGGEQSNYQYILGALQDSDSEFRTLNGEPIKGYKVGQIRYKSGPGRLDYLPLMSEYMPIYPENHAKIDNVPIVVLANGRTGSLSERTCLAAKQMNNGFVIGTRTYGALSPLLDDDPTGKAYTFTYSGRVGHENMAPFYLNIPFGAFLTNEGEILESVGIKPDIEVELDYSETGRDSQLERALEFIRTGK